MAKKGKATIELTPEQKAEREFKRKQEFAKDLMELEKKHGIKLQIKSEFVLVFEDRD